MQHLSRLGEVLSRERYWVVLVLAYLVAWVVPIQWMKEYWFLDYQATSAQPFVLPGFALALWGNRRRLLGAWEHARRNERYSKKHRSEGSLALLWVGCVLYFFAHFSRLALVGILGLVLMLIGVLVRTYGRRSVAAIPGPIGYLLLLVPWLPETAIGIINQQAMKIYVTLASMILFRVGFFTQQAGNAIVVKGVAVPLSFQLYGAQGVFAAIVFFWAYGLARNLPGRRIFLQTSVGMGVAFLVHLLRLMVMCVLGPVNLSWAKKLSDASPWYFTVLSIVVSLILLKVSAKLRRPAWLARLFAALHRISDAMLRPMDRLFVGAARTGKGVGKGIGILFAPLIWVSDQLLKGLEFLFKQLGRSNKALESMFKRRDRRRRK